MFGPVTDGLLYGGDVVSTWARSVLAGAGFETSATCLIITRTKLFKLDVIHLYQLRIILQVPLPISFCDIPVVSSFPQEWSISLDLTPRSIS